MDSKDRMFELTGRDGKSNMPQTAAPHRAPPDMARFSITAPVEHPLSSPVLFWWENPTLQATLLAEGGQNPPPHLMLLHTQDCTLKPSKTKSFSICCQVLLLRNPSHTHWAIAPLAAGQKAFQGLKAMPRSAAAFWLYFTRQVYYSNEAE